MYLACVVCNVIFKKRSFIISNSNYYTTTITNSGKPPKIQEDFSSDLDKFLGDGKYVLSMCSLDNFIFIF